MQNPAQASVIDTMLLNIFTNPIVDAGPDDSICEGNSYNVSAATSINHSSLIWTSSGTGVLINSTTINPTYTPSPADIASGTITLLLKAYGFAPCDSTIDDFEITIIPAPIANVGIDDSVCAGNSFTISTATANNYSSVSWLSSGTGTFTNGKGKINSRDQSIFGNIKETHRSTEKKP